MAKAKVVSIYLYRAEGPTKVLERLGRQRTVASYEEADRVLKTWSATAPKPGEGYDKIDFKVTWEDGQTYEGRYDLTQEDSLHARSRLNLIGSHIQQQLLFYSGLSRPRHLSPEDYERYLSQLRRSSGETPESYIQFLQTHEV